MTKQALLREGQHMDHCLQDGCYQEFAGEEELTGDAVWSLRDPDGVSWATLEIREGYRRDLSEPCLSNVVMAKGPGNRTVRRSVAQRLQPLVLAFRAAGRELDFSGETELVMADDGRVMRQDQAPVDIVEQSRARHVARVVRLQRPQGEGLREPMQGMSPSEYITAILRREFVSLGVDSQAVFVGSSAGIPWSEEPLTSDRVAVEEWCEREFQAVAGGASSHLGPGGGGGGVAVSRPVQARIVTTWSGQVVVPRGGPSA